jgi:hypothetical protein
MYLDNFSKKILVSSSVKGLIAQNAKKKNWGGLVMRCLYPLASLFFDARFAS